MNFKTKLKNFLAKVDYFSVTTDMWKNRSKNYFLALTIHFFDSEMNYQSLLFAFRKFKNSHSALNIKAFIINEIGDDLIEKVISFLLFKLHFYNKSNNFMMNLHNLDGRYNIR